MRPALLLLSLAGCAPLAMVLDPPLGQLARWHHAPALAAEQPVITPCPDANPACPQLHTRRAEACMATAMAARAPAAACPGSAARPMLDCAAQSYAAARRSNPHPALAAGQAQALICAANLSDNTHSVVLAREALRAAQASLSPLLRARAQALLDQTQGTTP
jgi:hypothetical protein